MLAPGRAPKLVWASLAIAADLVRIVAGFDFRDRPQKSIPTCVRSRGNRTNRTQGEQDHARHCGSTSPAHQAGGQRGERTPSQNDGLGVANKVPGGLEGLHTAPFNDPPTNDLKYFVNSHSIYKCSQASRPRCLQRSTSFSPPPEDARVPCTHPPNILPAAAGSGVPPSQAFTTGVGFKRTPETGGPSDGCDDGRMKRRSTSGIYRKNPPLRAACVRFVPMASSPWDRDPRRNRSRRTSFRPSFP